MKLPSSGQFTLQSQSRQTENIYHLAVIQIPIFENGPERMYEF